jgi:hypothetical protein
MGAPALGRPSHDTAATGGEPIFDANGRLAHDLDRVAAKLGPFLRSEGFA